MTLNEFRAVFSSPLIGNCGYTMEAAAAAIENGAADMIAIGRPLISTPDLVERYAQGIELNPDTDMANWYTPAGAEGYTDLPTATQAKLV